MQGQDLLDRAMENIEKALRLLHKVCASPLVKWRLLLLPLFRVLFHKNTKTRGTHSDL